MSGVEEVIAKEFRLRWLGGGTENREMLRLEPAGRQEARRKRREEGCGCSERRHDAS